MKPALKKWMPAAAIPAVIAATGVGLGISASATPQLEPKTAEQVIELMAGSEVTAFSGRIHLSTDLGIPNLPDAGAPASFGPPQDVQSTGPGDGPSSAVPDAGAGTSAADPGIAGLLNLVSGSHDARVYVDGPDKARVQLLERMGEKDVIRNGTSLWTYDSEANEAVHTTLPEPGSASASTFREHRGGHAIGEAPTPGQLADAFLAAAEPTTTTTVEEGSTVAGRDVYNLVLTPKKSQATLIEDVTIGVDAASGVPLAVSVDAVGQDAAAVDLAFTSFTPKAPDAKIFDFTPPAYATVHQKKLQQDSNWPKHTFGQKLQRPTPSKDDAAHRHPAGPADDWFTGTGWDTVATIPAEQVPAELKKSALVGQLATDVEGGKLLHTSLVNFLISDDGRVLIGAVPLERLQAVADGS